MNYLTETFQTMATDAAAYARKNEQLWSTFSVIVNQVTGVEQKLIALRDAARSQSREESSGMVADKNKKFAALAADVYRLERKLLFYAKQTGNSVLLQEVSMSENDLSSLDDSKLPNGCKTIVELGRAYLNRTADYGITAAELDGIATAIGEAESLSTTIDLSKNETKMATQTIKTLVPQIRNDLDMLDDAFEGMIADEAFLNGWWAIRKIKGRSKGKKKDDSSPAKPADGR